MTADQTQPPARGPKPAPGKRIDEGYRPPPPPPRGGKEDKGYRPPPPPPKPNKG